MQISKSIAIAVTVTTLVAAVGLFFYRRRPDEKQSIEEEKTE